METETCSILWFTAVWRLRHVRYCDSQYYGDWDMFDTVIYSSVGTDTSLIYSDPQKYGDWHQVTTALATRSMAIECSLLSHHFELQSQNCHSTSTSSCDFRLKLKPQRQKQGTGNYWCYLSHDRSVQISRAHSFSHICTYHVTLWRIRNKKGKITKRSQRSIVIFN